MNHHRFLLFGNSQKFVYFRSQIWFRDWRLSPLLRRNDDVANEFFFSHIPRNIERVFFRRKINNFMWETFGEISFVASLFRLVSPLRRFSKCEWSDLHLSDNNYMKMNETYGKSQRKRKLRKLEISSHEWDERSLELTKLSFADQKASEAPFKTLNLSTIECQKITQIVANFSLLRPICQFCFLSLCIT